MLAHASGINLCDQVNSTTSPQCASSENVDSQRAALLPVLAQSRVSQGRVSQDNPDALLPQSLVSRQPPPASLTIGALQDPVLDEDLPSLAERSATAAPSSLNPLVSQTVLNRLAELCSRLLQMSSQATQELRYRLQGLRDQQTWKVIKFQPGRELRHPVSNPVDRAQPTLMLTQGQSTKR